MAYGHELLDSATKSRVRNLFGTAEGLDQRENRVLDLMLEDLGIVYSSFVHQGSSLFLEASLGSSEVRCGDWTGADSQLWSRYKVVMVCPRVDWFLLALLVVDV